MISRFESLANPGLYAYHLPILNALLIHVYFLFLSINNQPPTGYERLICNYEFSMLAIRISCLAHISKSRWINIHRLFDYSILAIAFIPTNASLGSLDTSTQLLIGLLAKYSSYTF